LQDTTIGKRDIAEVENIKPDQPRIWEIISPHVKRRGVIRMMFGAPQTNLKQRYWAVAQIGKQSMVNPRIIMAREHSITFIATVPVG
jgi:hypothetical protein